MSDVLTKGTLFPEELIPTLINQVKGKSALAALAASEPIPFNGQREFIFTFDREVDVVAESGKHSTGGVTVEPVTVIPIKVEYGARISEEFLRASESVQLDYLKAFSAGFARKLARGFDVMAIHGVNPRTGVASSVIGNNNFDKKVTQIIEATGSAEADIENAIAAVQESEYDVTGLALAASFRSSLAKETDKSGRKLYPELAWGSEPGAVNGLKTVSNLTISANSSDDLAVIGDFENNFRWGYAKEIALEIIEYGNPDNDTTLGDLKGHGQIYLRGTAYLGWGILSDNAFAMIKKPKDDDE